MGQLTGRVAIVTGAARGQGRAQAVALAGAGATVVASDISATGAGTVDYPLGTSADLAETVELIRSAGGSASAAVADIRATADVDRLVESTVAGHGRIDIFVANAGICGHAALADISDEVWHDMIDTNLGGTFRCVRAVVPHMRRQRYGRVVAISSGAGRAGMATLGHYAASKWGVIGLIKSLALEVAADGITANVVCPGAVSTPMIHNDATYRLFRPDLERPTLDDVRPSFAARNPMGVPWLEPEDVARAVLFFATDPGRTSGAVLDLSLASSADRP
jgi:SDR family mycofactocin-dependent oxidoreductase